MKDLVLVATPEAAERYRSALREPLGARIVAEVSEPFVSRSFLARANELLSLHASAASVVALPSRALAALVAGLPRRTGKVLGEPLTPPAGDELAFERADLVFEWCSLGGAGELRAAHGWGKLDRVHIDVRGTPLSASDDVGLVLFHALALVEFAFGATRVVRSSFGSDDAELLVELELADAGALLLRARTGAPRLDVAVENDAFHFAWRAASDDAACQDEYERRGPNGAVRRAHAAKPAETRALQRLFAPNSAPLLSAQARLRVGRAMSSILGALPHRPALRPSAFRRASDNDAATLAELGLTGDVPFGPPACAFDPPSPPIPFEALAFHAGLKPVVFLTVEPEAEAATLRYFPGVHVERRERRVDVRRQDRWVDRRDSGNARVELYLSRDPALAREASRLQCEADPGRSLTQLGALMGYPSCCVDAFRRQDERANNTRNRYQTAARTRGFPWHAELSNFAAMIVPFFPCSYRCDTARDFARRVLEQLGSVEPALATLLAVSLRDPILYFEHGEYLRFTGRALDAETVEYTSVRVPRHCSDAISRLAAGLCSGERLVFTQDRLSVYRGERPAFVLDRAEPSLGVLAPF